MGSNTNQTPADKTPKSFYEEYRTLAEEICGNDASEDQITGFMKGLEACGMISLEKLHEWQEEHGFHKFEHDFFANRMAGANA